MTIADDNVKNALVGIKEQLSLKKKKSIGDSQLFEEDESRDFIQLQIACYKLPEVKDDKHPVDLTIRVPLPHALTDDETNVFLITKDIERGLRVDHEPTFRHYQDLLREHDALGLVSQIIPLRQLKTEYKEYEAKRKLSNLVDVMLCDDTVIRFVPQFLGKHFYQKKKKPVQVNLKAKNLKKEIVRVLSHTHLHFTMRGNCAQINVGRLTHSPEELASNIQAVVKKLKESFPGGWDNIRSINMRTSTSISVPVYLNMQSSVTEVKHPLYKEIKPVSGTLTTHADDEVLVQPSGDVFVLPPKKKLNKVKRKKDRVETEETKLEKEQYWEMKKQRKLKSIERANKEQAIKNQESEKSNKRKSPEEPLAVDENNSTNKKSRKKEKKYSEENKMLAKREREYLLKLREEEERVEELRKQRKTDTIDESDSSEEEEIEGGDSDEEIEEDSDEEIEGENDDDDDEDIESEIITKKATTVSKRKK